MSETPFDSLSDSTPDPFVARLAALAPTVDFAASRDLFERHRALPVASRHWLLSAAVVTIVIAGVVGVWALARDGESPTVPVTPIETTTPGAREPGGFDVLLVEQTSASAGTIATAVNDSELDEALRPVAGTHDDLGIDFGSSIVAVVNVAGNACPLDLEGFDVAGSVWTPRLVGSGQICEDIGITWAYVVAIDREQLERSVTFRLPPQFGGGEATAELGLELPGTGVPPAGPATGDEFVMLAVEETQLDFGSILVAYDTAQFDRMWTESFAGADRPSVDFDHLVAVAFTLPDDACPDILTRFAVEPPTGEGPTVWEPQFEPPPGGCRLPLITRTYVVGIDRSALGFLVTFRLPGNDVYEFDTNTVTVKLGRLETDPVPTAPTPTLTPTGIRVPLPPVGEPQIAIGTFGIVWVVQHDDGTVSVLDAVVDRPSKDDDGGVSGLGEVVFVSVNGDRFEAAATGWDEWGRTFNRPRTDDLVGYAGRIVGGEVEVLFSDATTIAGSPVPAGEPAAVPPDLDAIPLLDLGTLSTLSFSGPIWRQLDATLVVENGVGMLCSIDQDVPVSDLATCDDGASTAVRSTQPDVTRWYFGPLLAEFDEFGRIVQVVPMGGQDSRNDGPSAHARGGTVTITDVVPMCSPVIDPAVIEVHVLPGVPGEPVDVVVQIVSGGVVRGETVAYITEGSPAVIQVPIDSGAPPSEGTVLLRPWDNQDVVLDEAPTVGCT